MAALGDACLMVGVGTLFAGDVVLECGLGERVDVTLSGILIEDGG